MNILKDIPELVNANIISPDTADKIRAYYQKKRFQSPTRLLVLFGILGSILVGLGIILIIAHNWDGFSRVFKTFFAFFPLITGLIVCGYTLLKKPGSSIWRECTATFLFFAVGGCLSLVSQIYNVPGDLSSFLLNWMLLCFPLIYIMKSAVVSLLYLSGITYFGIESAYFSPDYSETYTYWMLLLGALPFYYVLFRKKPDSLYLKFHNWIICLSIIVMLGSVASQTEELLFISYMSLFGLFYLIGHTPWFTQEHLKNNPYYLTGALGTLVILLILSFDAFWQILRNENYEFSKVIRSPEFVTSLIVTLIALLVLFWKWKYQKINAFKPINYTFILFIVIFIIGLTSLLSVFLINLIIFAIGIITIRNGAKDDHLGILNFGLLIITALFICRFFDTDLSFVTRGILFLSVGIGFFLSNTWVLKKRRENE